MKNANARDRWVLLDQPDGQAVYINLAMATALTPIPGDEPATRVWFDEKHSIAVKGIMEQVFIGCPAPLDEM